MKKLITTLAFVSAFAFFAPAAHAGTIFNHDTQDLPTVMVSNVTDNPCYNTQQGAGCWSTSISADAGDVVAVRVYYHNTGNETARNVLIGMNPRVSNSSSTHTFRGGVKADNASPQEGSATVRLSSSQSLSFISGSVKWYPNQSGNARSTSNESALFGNGISIGDIAQGWPSQGSVVAQFRVDGSSNNNNNNNDCRINSFIASDTSIDEGDSTRLRWTTTGCDYVDIRSNDQSFYNRDADDDVSVSPDRDTTYTLRAYDFNGDLGDTDTETIRVDDNNNNNNSCSISNFYAGIPNITRGQSSSLIWNVSGDIDDIDITPGYENRGTQSGFISVNPLATTTYQLTVRCDDGSTRTQTATVIVYIPATPVITQSPIVIQQPPRIIRNVVTAQSAPSLLELRVESAYDRMCINGTMDYTVTYRNISNQTLQNTVLRFTHPKEITYLSSSRGDYEIADSTLTIDLGSVRAGEEGTITVRSRVNETAVRGNLTVATATVVYTNANTRAQENAIAYSLITVSDDCPNLLGASVFGFGSFLPDTLLEWLLLILVILALIVLGRQLYKKKGDQK